MRLSLISLDMMLALPLLFLSLTTLFGYAYRVQESINYTMGELAGTLALYANSSIVYNEAASEMAFNASQFPVRMGGNAVAYMYNYSERPPGCAVQYACRIVVISGNARVMVMKQV